MADMNETKQKAIDAFEGELKNVRFDGAPTTYSRSIDGAHFVVQIFGRTWDVWPTTDKWRCRWKADAPAKDGLRGFWNSLNSAYLNHVAKLKSAAAERRLSKAAYLNPVTKAASDTAPIDRMAVLEEKVEGFYATVDNLLKLIETVNNGQNATANADRKKHMDAVSNIHSRIDFTATRSIPSIRKDIDAHNGRLNKIENFLWSEAGFAAEHETVTPEAKPRQKGRAGEGRAPIMSREAAHAAAMRLRDFCNRNGYEGIGHSIGLLIEELKR